MTLAAKTEAQKAQTPPNPFKVEKGANAILLVPIEDGPREKLTDLFYEADLMPSSEDDRKERGLPVIRDRINLKRLREDDVIFTAVVVPKTYGKKKQVSEWTLKISKAVPVKGLIPAISDIGGEDVQPDYSALVDAIQKDAHPFSMKLSNDKLLSMRSL